MWEDLNTRCFALPLLIMINMNALISAQSLHAHPFSEVARLLIICLYCNQTEQIPPVQCLWKEKLFHMKLNIQSTLVTHATKVVFLPLSVCLINVQDYTKTINGFGLGGRMGHGPE